MNTLDKFPRLNNLLHLYSRCVNDKNIDILREYDHDDPFYNLIIHLKCPGSRIIPKVPSVKYFCNSISEKIKSFDQKDSMELLNLLKTPSEGVLLLNYPEPQIVYYHLGTESETGNGWLYTFILNEKMSQFSLYNPRFKEHVDEGLSNQQSTVIAHLAFLKFVKNEIIVLDSNSGKNQKKIRIDEEKIINNAKCKVEVIDSKYFRTIVRNTPFGVKGHFRLQACGLKHQDRKLIYIQDFVKEGYQSKARKDG